MGRSAPFTDEQLRSLYPAPVDYLTRFENATTTAVDAGVLLPDDARLGEIAATHTAQFTSSR
ncbi:hypothetical protein BTZ20_0151 [Rhodococcus sp. MTM3W5.2]|nr:hypothetical protein BTZ20_0151 [Rhodococcus sp. MTM3W5.2]